MNFENSPSKTMRNIYETPSRFLNLNSHISSFRPWSESFKKEKFFMGLSVASKQIQPFQNHLQETNLKIEDLEGDLNVNNQLFAGLKHEALSENLESFFYISIKVFLLHRTSFSLISARYQSFLSKTFEFTVSEESNDSLKGKITTYMMSSKFNCGIMTGSLENKENFFGRLFKCKFCGNLFDKGCSLGGHISRVHKEESKTKSVENYIKKLEKAKLKKLR